MENCKYELKLKLCHHLTVKRTLSSHFLNILSVSLKFEAILDLREELKMFMDHRLYRRWVLDVQTLTLTETLLVVSNVSMRLTLEHCMTYDAIAQAW